MARGQGNQLGASVVQIGVEADEQEVGPAARKRVEGLIDLVAGAGVRDLDNLHPHGAGGCCHVSQRALGMALAGLTSTATRVAAGTSSRRSSSRFAVTSPL